MGTDDAFARAMLEWTSFYSLLGSAAATLLGLLFVALFLRLNIFHQRILADVCDFATFTFSTFVMTIVIAALGVAPHEQGSAIAGVLLAGGTVGLLLSGWVARDWIQLNRLTSEEGRAQSDLMSERHPVPASQLGQGVTYLIGMVMPYLGVLLAAGLVWTNHMHALGWLAVSECWLLMTGTVAAWVMLSHARGDANESNSLTK